MTETSDAAAREATERIFAWARDTAAAGTPSEYEHVCDWRHAGVDFYEQRWGDPQGAGFYLWWAVHADGAISVFFKHKWHHARSRPLQTADELLDHAYNSGIGFGGDEILDADLAIRENRLWQTQPYCTWGIRASIAAERARRAQP
jgi:hypothetical protein